MSNKSPIAGVLRHIGLVTVLNGIGQIIAAARAEHGFEHPVSFDELNEGRMLATCVAEMAASRKVGTDLAATMTLAFRVNSERLASQRATDVQLSVVLPNKRQLF
jgi:hypothetical protein